MHAWYVTFQEGFEFAMGPNDPPADHVVLVFLTEAAARAWVSDNHAELWAKIVPCTVLNQHLPLNS